MLLEARSAWDTKDDLRTHSGLNPSRSSGRQTVKKHAAINQGKSEASVKEKQRSQTTGCAGLKGRGGCEVSEASALPQ